MKISIKRPANASFLRYFRLNLVLFGIPLVAFQMIGAVREGLGWQAAGLVLAIEVVITVLGILAVSAIEYAVLNAIVRAQEKRLNERSHGPG